MANQEHLDILKQGVEMWNQWRKEHPNIRPNLSNVDLSGANLSGANLSNVDLSSANLRVTDLNGANLSGADLCLYYPLPYTPSHSPLFTQLSG